MDTTIRVPEDIKKKLDELKIHPRQPYHEVIQKLLEVYEEWKELKKSTKSKLRE